MVNYSARLSSFKISSEAKAGQVLWSTQLNLYALLEGLNDKEEAKRTTLWYDVQGFRFFNFERISVTTESSVGTIPNGTYAVFFTPDALQEWEPDVNYNAHASQAPKYTDGSLFKTLNLNLNRKELEQSSPQKFFKKDAPGPLTSTSNDQLESITAFSPGQLVVVCVVPPTGFEGDLEYSVSYDMKVLLHGPMPEPKDLETDGAAWVTEFNGLTATFDTGAGLNYDNAKFCINSDIDDASHRCAIMGEWDRAFTPWASDVLQATLTIYDDCFKVNDDGYREVINLSEIKKGYDIFVLDSPLLVEVIVDLNLDDGTAGVAEKKELHYMIRAKTNGKDELKPVDKEMCVFCDAEGMPFNVVYPDGPRVQIKMYSNAKILYGTVTSIPPRDFSTTSFAARLVKGKVRKHGRLANHPRLISPYARKAAETQTRLKAIVDAPATGNLANMITGTSSNSDAILSTLEAIAAAVAPAAASAKDASDERGDE